jgi:hypothetical protein
LEFLVDLPARLVISAAAAIGLAAGSRRGEWLGMCICC